MKFILLAAACFMLGCTTMATVAPGAMTAAIDELKKGERISVRTDAGWHEDLRVVEIDAGKVRAGHRREPIVFARPDILEIRVSRGAPGKTAALAAAIFFGGQLALCGNLTKNDGC
jgi:hypothetical protein